VSWAGYVMQPGSNFSSSKSEREFNTNGHAYLDLVRAIAASLVLLQHASQIFEWPRQVPTGGLGVVLFFLLSGFLIFQSGCRRIKRSPPYFIPFMIDRFARIFTVYIPALIFVAAVNACFGLSNHAQEGMATGPIVFLGNLFLLQDYPFFQAAANLLGGHAYHIRAYNTAEQFWTIPVEFWIYVWFGLVFFYGLIRERINRTAAILLFLISTPVVVWHAAGGGGNGLALVWFYGALASYIWISTLAKSSGDRRIGAFVFIMGIIFFVGRLGKVGFNFYDHGVIICLAIALFGGLSFVESMPPIPGLVRRICNLLAAYSYSLYLVHNTVLIIFRERLFNKGGAVDSLVAIGAAHFVAICFYLLFEQHYRAIGKLVKKHFLAESTVE